MVNKILTLDDVDSFNLLGLQVNSNFAKLFDLRKIIESGFDFLFGYYEDSKLIGFIHVTKSFEVVDIVNIVVDESYRRKGIGSILLEYIFNYFKDEVSSYMLEVNINNVAAIELYKRKNFLVIHKRSKYYGNDDALIMKRDV